MNINKLLHDPEDFGISKYQWRADGKLDVFQEVNLSNRGLDSLPFSFGKIKGKFLAYNNNFDESSIQDLPESCEGLFLAKNNFKNLNGFNTKANMIWLMHNELYYIKGIEWIDDFKLKGFVLKSCDKIKDWDNLPFVEDILNLEGSSIGSLDCLKNKKLKDLTIANTKIISLARLEIEGTLDLEKTKIATLKDIYKCPKIIWCDKDKEDRFINELKEMFPNSFNLKQINGRLYEHK